MPSRISIGSFNNYSVAAIDKREARGTYGNGFVESDGLIHSIRAVVKSVAPAVKKESEAQLTRRMLFQRGANGNEVLQRLRHLATTDC